MTDELRDDIAPPGSVAEQSVLPDDIRESIALGSFCAISGQPSSLSNLAYSNAITNNNLTQQNTVANQQAMNQVSQSVLGNAVNLVADVSPMEAVAVTKLDTGNDIAQQLMDLKAAIESGTGANVPPSPLHPSPLNPRPNPAGGIIATASITDFPITLALEPSLGRVRGLRNQSGGTRLNVDSTSFPVEIHLKSSGRKPIGTIADVSTFRFPFTVDIEEGSGGPIKQESPQGPSSLTVSAAKFPVQINLTP
ncbi:MAG TPA: hypothetical protein DC047_13470 [Blastocatellia bacterium]|nr:hypothetical protein [Blastocatellia bacterium]